MRAPESNAWIVRNNTNIQLPRLPQVWLPFEYGKYVWALNPATDQYALGKMVALDYNTPIKIPNNKLIFPTFDTPERSIPFMMIDFDVKGYSGSPAVSVHRNFISPA